MTKRLVSLKLCKIVALLSVLPEKMCIFVPQFWKGLWHIEKAHFALFRWCELGHFTKLVIGVMGRTLFLVRSCNHTIYDQVGLLFSLFNYKGSPSPTSMNEDGWGSTFYICLQCHLLTALTEPKVQKFWDGSVMPTSYKQVGHFWGSLGSSFSCMW